MIGKHSESIKQEERLRALREYDGPDAVISSHELTLKLRETPQSLIRVKSLIPSLDAVIEDFRDGELIAVSGPTKNGKTLFAQTLTVNFNRQQYPSLWFTYEVPVRQFLSQFSDMPLIYLPQKLRAHALPWLEERVFESFVKYRTRIVFIDHLHYLIDLARLKNPSLEIGQIIRSLKSLAVSEGLIIFLLCHTQKGSSEKDISYESIRDSSFVAQESDCCLMIKRVPIEENGKKTWSNLARLRVEFHRRTGVLEKVINLTKVDGLLLEQTDRTPLRGNQ